MSGLPVVYIEREPLLNMVFASVEMFNRECLGYLFGYSSGKPFDRYVITNTVQLAAVVHRARDLVQQSKRACQRLQVLIDKAPKLFPYLADFHSHPSVKVYPDLFDLSESDRKNISEADQFCMVIAIVRRTKRLLEWTLRDNGTRLRGSLDRFDIHFTAHRVVHDEEGKQVKDEKGIPLTERLPLRVAKMTLRALNNAAKSR